MGGGLQKKEVSKQNKTKKPQRKKPVLFLFLEY